MTTFAGILGTTRTEPGGNSGEGDEDAQASRAEVHDRALGEPGDSVAEFQQQGDAQ
ncbi:hypothetical protein AB0I39_07000 [Kitasatospora purpeofusca]|uniref:hypothetical protein n=1 Tax=Kitasatospora purpeofusca TaxID=67352 RepID=UPI0034012230